MARLPYIIPYDPEFLGDGFVVPLPKPSRSEAGRALKEKLLNRGAVYDYIYFSLVMHAERCQALYTGCNLDGDLQKQVSRGSWSIDDRLSEYQIGNEAYQDTPNNPNPWDRGHLVRRQDVCWGTRRERAKEASDSTFFYTNSSFQHHNFNGDEWNQLEDWILERVTETSAKICVLTGQFLTENDPWLTVNPGVRVQIPTAFWKVIVLRDPTDNGNDLTAAAFILPQSEDFIRTFAGQDAEPWPKEKLRTYQVEIRDLEQLSHLNFGDLRNIDDFPWSVVRFRTDKMWDVWRPITEPTDIAVGGTRRRRSAGGRARRVFSNRTLASSAPGISIAPPVLNPTDDKLVPIRTVAVEPATSSHDCGCGGTVPLEQQVATLSRKIERLAETMQVYAQQKIAEADEIEEAAESETATSRMQMLITEGKPVDIGIKHPDTTPSGQALNTLITQAQRDRTRAETLQRQLARITGGTPTSIADFPSCVLIGDSLGYFCTGVLISDRVVLSAAHCGQTPDGRRPERVLLGVVDQGLAGLPSAQKRSVIHRVRHPQYLETRLPWNDLLVLILDTAVSITSEVNTIPILAENRLASIQDVVIVGFGDSDLNSTRGFGRQRKATVPLTNTFDLMATTPEQRRQLQVRNGFSAPHEFYAGAEDSGIDTCRGDSGGPVYVQETDHTWHLLGITSRGLDYADTLCGDGGLYTTVACYQNWIQQVRNRYSV